MRNLIYTCKIRIHKAEMNLTKYYLGIDNQLYHTFFTEQEDS